MEANCELLKKTKVVIFQKKLRKEHKYKFFLDKNSVDIVSQYTYLGIKLTSNGKFSDGIEVLREKSKFAMGAFQKRFNLSRLPVDIANKIFDSMIMPILTYSAEVWGIYNKIDFEHWEKTPTEKAHLRFCKSYLSLNRRASNYASRSEMGRFPLKIAIDKQILKYFFRLRDLNENTIVKQAFILSEKLWKKGHKSIHTYVDSMQNMYNFNQNILRESKYKESFTKKLITYFIEIWRNNISNSRKLQLYSKIKSNYEPEQYLNAIKNEKLKKSLTKLRVSNHILMIEQGRYQNPKLSREHRFCPICVRNGTEYVEDESHLICDCPAYNDLRENLFELLNDKMQINLSSLSQEIQTFTILNPDSSKCYQDIALFIYSCIRIRSTLVI